MLCPVRDEIHELAGAAAVEATAQLKSLAFGAVDKVLLSGVHAGVDQGTEYYIVSWSVVSMGMEDSHISMVILPEFLEDGGGPALAVQMAAYVVDKVLDGAQDA